MKDGWFILVTLLIIGFSAVGSEKAPRPLVVRVGYFPNITHAQALVARELSRQGNGWFESRLGAEIQWFSYNAGPSAMEAFFAKSLDLTYVGPNPALNAYIRSQGKEVRILAGATRGGAGLVVQKAIEKAADLKGQKIATPQFGNTQDVAARSWLEQQGFKVTLSGGDVQVVPTPNPEQLGLFKRKALVGAWTVEPWVSRLELEAGGQLMVNESNAITTLLAVRVSFFEKNAELARKFAAAHAELTAWINTHPQEAQKLVRAALKAETKREFGENLLRHAWPRMHFSTEVSLEAMETIVASAQKVGYLKNAIPLKTLIVPP